MSTHSTMFADMKNPQILDSVVGLFSVDVVDVFPRFKFPTEVLLHNPSMLVMPDTVHRDASVLLLVLDALIQGVAFLGAELFNGLSRLGEIENLAALLTLGFAFAVSRLGTTIEGAVQRGFLAVFPNSERALAVDAGEGSHDLIVSAESTSCNQGV